MTEKVYTIKGGLDKYYAEFAALGRMLQSISRRAAVDATLTPTEISRVNEAVAQLTSDVLHGIDKLSEKCATLR